ncbi:hypothetical protein FHR81_002782 [Actinoalloteichus hoggarensis]|uniref:Uncharacterized protein n=1 Tax=Actinoalloteichus hoggarensis TaxID=1470176 RepID=A0A221VY13_9PSEU|nr:DUF4129 domain-containing protein [Actinoalloteichus hoggarensis]ASO18378.1 hypothetical protein AHOG_03605 [Actinoalloteichus hoggarensis]MBB5921742.1 hypothetical protein [Actinoalloteichus hoggarensis]
MAAARGRSGIPYDGGLVAPPATTEAPTTAPPNADEVTPRPESNEWIGAGFGLFLLVILVLVIVGLLGILLSFRLPNRRTRVRGPRRKAPPDEQPPADPSPAGASVSAAGVRAALHVLDEQAAGSPGDRVVEAWRLFEQAAAEAGTRRRAPQTPSEFAAELVAARAVPEAPVAELRALYHRARFDPAYRTSPDDVVRARAALTAVAAALDDAARTADRTRR